MSNLESLDSQIDKLKAERRKIAVSEHVQEKFTELVELCKSGGSVESVETVARSLINFLNEKRNLSGKKGKRGRKPKEE